MISVQKIIKKINKFGIQKVDCAIVVGSGLMNATVDLKNPIVIPYDKVGMPKSKVKGHSGQFIFGEYNGKVVALVSRLHFYESGDMNKVRMPFAVVAALGCKQIILLTSSGGVNSTFAVGDIMLIKDHINLSGYSPLVGIDPVVFTPMANAYDKDLIEKILDIANKNNIDIKQGVHFQFAGPYYETYAEINAIRMLGADSVSMSTSYDCIISNYFNMKVCGMAVIVNTFDNQSDMKKLNHEEVLENAEKACKKIKVLLSNLI